MFWQSLVYLFGAFLYAVITYTIMLLVKIQSVRLLCLYKCQKQSFMLWVR